MSAAGPAASPRRVAFLGLELASADLEGAAAWLGRELEAPERGRPLLLLHANCHTLFCLAREPRLLELARAEAELLLEGVALTTALRLAGGGRAADTNGSDLAPRLLRGLPRPPSAFLLGGEPGVVAAAARRLAAERPGLRVLGAEPGFFPPERLGATVDRIAALEPDLVLLGLGSPLQERVALAFAGRRGPRVVWAVGGLFDLLAGRKPRAPAWARRLRLEWLFRLAREPRRLWRRTFVEVPWLATRLVAGRVA